MAMPGRRNHADLSAALASEPFRFRFFQAVRILMLSEKAAGRPAGLPRRLRFRTPATLGFVPSDLIRFETVRGRGEDPSGEEEPLQELEVGFLGLTGPSGVLPQHYTELLMERRTLYRDTAAHAFLDIFTHRAVCLFHAAWRKYRFYLDYEMGVRSGFTRQLLDLIATDRPELRGDSAVEREPQPVPSRALAFFAGILGRRPLPSGSLESMLSAYFGVRIALEQFVGQWLEVGTTDTLPELGRGAILGGRVWDRQTKFRLRIGPLDRPRFHAFQPGGEAARALRQLVETCVGPSLNCDVSLILERRALGDGTVKMDASEPLRLGLSTWLFTRAPEQDLDDVRYRLI